MWSQYKIFMVEGKLAQLFLVSTHRRFCFNVSKQLPNLNFEKSKNVSHLFVFSDEIVFIACSLSLYCLIETIS